AGVSFEQALAIQEKLVREHPDEDQFREDLATTHIGRHLYSMQLGRWDRVLQDQQKAVELFEMLAQASALPKYRRALAISYRNLASNRFLSTGSRAEGTSFCRKALEIQERLVKDDPDDLYYRFDLGWTHDVLGSLHAEAGRFDDAQASYQKALDIWGK